MAAQETPAQPKIKLYWLDDSRAQRIAWLLEELGLEYDVEVFRRLPDRRAAPELEKIHPLGKSPIVGVTVPDAADPAKGKELVLAESGVIAQYLTDHFDRSKSLTPKRYRDGQEGQVGGETDEWMRYQYFMHYTEGSLMPPIVITLVLSILKSPTIPFFIRPITSSIVGKMFAVFLAPEMAKHLAFLESQLETSPGNGNYLCGAHLTTADILMGFPLQLARDELADLNAAQGKGKLLDNYPKLCAYLKRLEEEPGYKRAEARMSKLEKKA